MNYMDLKPCPFCGGNAKEVFEESKLAMYIQCESCNARGSTFYGHGYDIDDIGKYIDDMAKDVYNAWNKRK